MSEFTQHLRPYGIAIVSDIIAAVELERTRKAFEQFLDDPGPRRTVILPTSMTYVSLIPDYPPTPGDDV